jgi:hypothetical protein
MKRDDCLRYLPSPSPLLQRSNYAVQGVSLGKKSGFPAEINIHFPGMENLAAPTVLVFPTLLICLDLRVHGIFNFGNGTAFTRPQKALHCVLA